VENKKPDCSCKGISGFNPQHTLIFNTYISEFKWGQPFATSYQLWTMSFKNFPAFMLLSFTASQLYSLQALE
jgi:hypothetical protein